MSKFQPYKSPVNVIGFQTATGVSFTGDFASESDCQSMIAELQAYDAKGTVGQMTYVLAAPDDLTFTGLTPVQQGENYNWYEITPFGANVASLIRAKNEAAGVGAPGYWAETGSINKTPTWVTVTNPLTGAVELGPTGLSNLQPCPVPFCGNVAAALAQIAAMRKAAGV